MVEARGVAREAPDASREVGHRHRRAGFRVAGVVVQLVGAADGLAHPASTHCARAVAVALDDLAPESLRRRLPAAVAGRRRDLGDARREVEESHRVAARRDGVHREPRAPQGMLDHPLRVRDEAPVAGDPREPTERQLHLGMQVDALVAARTERGHDVLLAEGVNRHRESAIWHGEVDAIANLDAVHPRHGREALTLYTTAEPCPMCQAAILWAGIRRVVYGTSIPFLAAHGWWQIDLRAVEVAARRRPADARLERAITVRG